MKWLRELNSSSNALTEKLPMARKIHSGNRVNLYEARGYKAPRENKVPSFLGCNRIPKNVVLATFMVWVRIFTPARALKIFQKHSLFSLVVSTQLN